jgi:hypothetical protein
VSIDEQVQRIQRRGLLRRPQTAGEIAERIGEPSGRSITLGLAQVVDQGLAIRHAGRKPTYSRA